MNAARNPAYVRPEMCQAADLLPDEPECLRVAVWAWQPIPDDHPYLLCNFHGEPLAADPPLACRPVRAS